MKNFESLRKSSIENLIGKTIEWKAPAYKANEPYTGKCVIKSVDYSKRNPLEVEVLEGDNLGYSFIDEYSTESSDKAFSFSDSDRYVDFREMEEDEIVEMDYDKVYSFNGKKLIQTRRRVITDGEHQAVLMILDPAATETKRQEVIWKMYPRFGNLEGFLPANSLMVWMHKADRFDLLVNRINEDKEQN